MQAARKKRVQVLFDDVFLKSDVNKAQCSFLAFSNPFNLSTQQLKIYILLNEDKNRSRYMFMREIGNKR